MEKTRSELQKDVNELNRKLADKDRAISDLEKFIAKIQESLDKKTNAKQYALIMDRKAIKEVGLAVVEVCNKSERIGKFTIDEALFVQNRLQSLFELK